MSSGGGFRILKQGEEPDTDEGHFLSKVADLQGFSKGLLLLRGGGVGVEAVPAGVLVAGLSAPLLVALFDGGEGGVEFLLKVCVVGLLLFVHASTIARGGGVGGRGSCHGEGGGCTGSRRALTPRNAQRPRRFRRGRWVCSIYRVASATERRG